jgi:hypothetical protein
MICASPLLHAPANVDDGYAKFLAWAATFAPTDRTSSGSPNSEQPSSVADVHTRWIYPLTKGGIMWGSSRGGAPSFGLYTHDSTLTRVMQHMFQDANAALACEGKVVVFFAGVIYGESETVGRDLNGYSSQSYPTYVCYYGAEMHYFDPRYPTKRIRALSNSWTQTDL